MKTKAAVCRAFGAPLSVEAVELAEPQAGEVLIRTAACAICHSDIFYVDGAWGGDYSGRGQLSLYDRFACRSQIRVSPRERCINELGRWRVLGRDGRRQLF